MIDELKMQLWGRCVALPIEYNCYGGREVTNEQIEAVQRFISHPEWIERSRSKVEAYCQYIVQNDAEIEKKSNIFEYIKPDCLFVKRDKKNPRIALMCDYRYDVEHGIAIVFSSDGQITVGTQDIIL